MVKAVLAKRDPPSETRCCLYGRVLRGRDAAGRLAAVGVRETWAKGRMREVYGARGNPGSVAVLDSGGAGALKE